MSLSGCSTLSLCPAAFSKPSAVQAALACQSGCARNSFPPTTLITAGGPIDGMIDAARLGEKWRLYLHPELGLCV